MEQNLQSNIDLNNLNDQFKTSYLLYIPNPNYVENENTFFGIIITDFCEKLLEKS